MRTPRHPGGSAAQCAIKRLVSKRIGPTVLLARHMAGAPMGETRQPFQRLIAEWSKLCITHSPAALQLLYDEFAIKEQINFASTELGRKINRSYDCTPLRNVVRGCADRCRD